MSRLEQLSPAAVDDEIVRLMNILEERTDDFREASQRAAESEARYKYRFAKTMIDVIEASTDRKVTVAEREARVDVATADELSAHLISKAAAQSAREALRSVETQIDAVRTLAANYRNLGGHQ